MGFFSNLFGSIVCPGFYDLLNNHRDALDNWLRGGYCPRGIMPKNVREQFREYDKRWRFISDNTGNGWVRPENFTLSQRQFCVNYKQEILHLYSVYKKWDTNENTIYYLSTHYPCGINEIAIKYLRVEVKNFYTPFALRHSFFYPTIVYSIDDLTPQQTQILVKHKDEIKIAHNKNGDECIESLKKEHAARKKLQEDMFQHTIESFERERKRKEQETTRKEFVKYKQEAENKYGELLDKTLQERDFNLPVLAVGLTPKGSSLIDRTIFKFSQSNKDEDIEWRFSLHYDAFYFDVRGLSNSVIRDDVMSCLANYLKDNRE